MVEYAKSDPAVWTDGPRVTVNLRLADDTTDAVWRELFNDLTRELGAVDAEAMGDRGLTVIVVRLDKSTDRDGVFVALNEVHEIARRTDNGQIGFAVLEWWRLGSSRP
jgi:hypothetical protein